MSLDLKAANYTLSGLKPFPVAITTVCNGRTNGLMSLSAAAAGIVPEAPRLSISLTKYNLTHDLVMESRVFAMHLLCRDDDLIDASLDILMALGGSSGRDGEKLGKLRTRPGVTGSPILLDTLCYVEARVVKAFDADENTIFLADAVASEWFRKGARLDVGHAWSKLPKEWIETYERNHEPQLDDCRRRRGLIA